MKEFLGGEAFARLRTLDRKIPSPGEIILSESRGLRLETIASNLKNFVAKLDQEIGSSVEAARDESALTLWRFIGRLDDLADIGSRQDGDAETREYVTNLLEFNLSLVNELQKQLEPAAIEMLVKRFSAREALRGANLRPYVEPPALPES
ncbi:hypothetical protein [Terriglobus saanensis]|uniref:hypothetical protein n=1 Tax=Terriglobus saanensis TaxID=870903 RepID=UPI001186DDF8|nr:hypothetical protein [Terriglobus saanensis]